MERVTDEWLRKAHEAGCVAGEKAHDQGSLENVLAYRLAFAQAVARECVRLASERADAWEDIRPLDGTVPLWIGYVVADIRARFGLGD